LTEVSPVEHQSHPIGPTDLAAVWVMVAGIHIRFGSSALLLLRCDTPLQLLLATTKSGASLSGTFTPESQLTTFFMNSRYHPLRISFGLLSALTWFTLARGSGVLPSPHRLR
jgi:hypothetical protein